MLNSENFPDEDFRECVKRALDKNNDNILSKTEIEAGYTLEAEYYPNIEDITGIEYLTELTKI